MSKKNSGKKSGLKKKLCAILYNWDIDPDKEVICHDAMNGCAVRGYIVDFEPFTHLFIIKMYDKYSGKPNGVCSFSLAEGTGCMIRNITPDEEAQTNMSA